MRLPSGTAVLSDHPNHIPFAPMEPETLHHAEPRWTGSSFGRSVPAPRSDLLADGRCVSDATTYTYHSAPPLSIRGGGFSGVELGRLTREVGVGDRV